MLVIVLLFITSTTNKKIYSYDRTLYKTRTIVLCLEIFYLAWKMSNPGLPSYNPDTLPVAQPVKASVPDVPDVHAQTVQSQKTRRAIAIAAGVIIVGALAVAIYFIVTKPKNVAYSLCTNQNKACCNPQTGICSSLLLTLPSGQIWGDNQCQNTKGLQFADNSFAAYSPNETGSKQPMASICVTPQTVIFPALKSKTSGKMMQADGEEGTKTVRLQSCASCNRAAYFCPIYMKNNPNMDAFSPGSTDKAVPVYLNETSGNVPVVIPTGGSGTTATIQSEANPIQPCWEFPPKAPACCETNSCEDSSVCVSGQVCVPTTGKNVITNPIINGKSYKVKCNPDWAKDKKGNVLECGFINPDGTINDYENNFKYIEFNQCPVYKGTLSKYWQTGKNPKDPADNSLISGFHCHPDLCAPAPGGQGKYTILGNKDGKVQYKLEGVGIQLGGGKSQ
jgi:hypothetical protein